MCKKGFLTKLKPARANGNTNYNRETKTGIKGGNYTKQIKHKSLSSKKDYRSQGLPNHQKSISSYFTVLKPGAKL